MSLIGASGYDRGMDPTFHWRGPVTNPELNALHAEAFGHERFDDDWVAQLDHHSLGWVCARQGPQLIGFVNLAWDGGFHAFVLDTIVAGDHRRQGIGTKLVAIAIEHARTAGCEWLHVDFDPDLRAFCFDACGFKATDAGLIAL